MHRMRMRSPSCHNVDSYSVTFTDMKLFSDIKVPISLRLHMVNYNHIDFIVLLDKQFFNA